MSAYEAANDRNAVAEDEYDEPALIPDALTVDSDVILFGPLL